MQTYTPPGRSSRKCKFGWFDSWDWCVNRVVGLAGRPRIQAAPGRIAIDPHIHSLFSHCSVMQSEAIIRRAHRLGLGGVAIMDHDEVAGSHDAVLCAERLKHTGAIPDEFLVIPAVEISSQSGHIGALFVDEAVPKRMSVADTVRAIHDAGGLAVAVHPYGSMGIGPRGFDAPFDAVEEESGFFFSGRLAALNRDLCADPRLAGAAKLGSSDAHYACAIGWCYTVVESEPTVDAVRQAILAGKTSARATAPYLRLRRLLGLAPRYRRPPKAR